MSIIVTVAILLGNVGMGAEPLAGPDTSTSTRGNVCIGGDGGRGRGVEGNSFDFAVDVVLLMEVVVESASRILTSLRRANPVASTFDILTRC